MRTARYRVGGYPTPECDINIVENALDLQKLDNWLQEKREEYLGLDSETNARDPFEPGFICRATQMADSTTTWFVPIWDKTGRFTCGNIISGFIRRHPRWVAHYAEADERFTARGLPGQPVRWEDQEPHFSDTQTVLAMYDPRTVTTFNKKDRIHPAIPRRKGLKETTSRLLTPTLAAAEGALHTRFRELAQATPGVRGSMAMDALKAWGFANIPIDDPAYELYSALDPLCTIRLFELMRAQLTADGKWPRVLAALREQWMVDRATYQGMQVDAPYARWLDGQLAQVIETNAEFLAGYGIPPSAQGPSVGKAFQSLGVQSPKTDQDGKQSWDKDALKALLDKAEEIFHDTQYAGVGVPEVVHKARNLAESVSAVRKAGKYRSNWVAPMLWTVDHADGAMHPSIRATGTVTTRMSCQKTQTAGPLHSAPKHDTRLRAAVRAERGWAIVTADFRQAEPFVMAALSGDQDYLRDLLSGDINSIIAQPLYGDAYNPAEGKAPGTASYLMRQSVKFAWLAACYGAAEGKVDALLHLPGSGSLGRWRRMYPTFWAYADEMNHRSVLELDSGHRVPLWDKFWVDDTGALVLRTDASGRPKPSRLGLNGVTQGTQADILKLSMHRLNVWGWAWALRFFMHDELVGCVPLWMADAFMRVLEEAMTVRYRGVTIHCEATIEGRTWQPQPREFSVTDLEDVDDE
jgi:hypothetical protein